jgi:GTP-binding protein EngB required for normal cell division
MSKINSKRPVQELEIDILKLRTENITMKKLVEPIKILISSNTQKEAIEKIDKHFIAKIKSNELEVERIANKITSIHKQNAEKKFLENAAHINCSTNTLVNAPPKYMPINRLAAKQVLKNFKK